METIKKSDDLAPNGGPRAVLGGDASTTAGTNPGATARADACRGGNASSHHIAIALLVLGGLALLSLVSWLVYSLPCPVNPLGCIP
jgi:hypothetical protein